MEKGRDERMRRGTSKDRGGVGGWGAGGGGGGAGRGRGRGPAEGDEDAVWVTKELKTNKNNVNCSREDGVVLAACSRGCMAQHCGMTFCA